MPKKLQWETVKMKLGDLVEYEKNPRKITDEMKKHLEKSLKKFGLVEIPVIDKDGTIVAGHQRLKVFREYNEPDTEIDVRVPNRKLTKKEFQEYNIRSNKNTGDWDFNTLANDFELDDLFSWGWDKEELDINLWKPEIDEEKLDEVPEPQKEAVSKLGDIFLIDGKHRVMCGDSTKIEDVEKLMDGKKAELLFTSPPYADLREYNGNKNLEITDLSKFIKAFFDFVSYQVINLGMKRENLEIVEYWNTYIKEAKEAGYKFLSWNVWDRSEYGCGSIANATAMFQIAHEWIFVFGKEKKELKLTVPNKNAGKRKKGTQRTGKNDSMVSYETTIRDKSQLKTIYKHSTAFSESAIYKHPAMFPSSFPMEYIEAMTSSSEICIDPFLGSGSVLIASEQTNRICYGMELDPIYIDVILRRYKTLYPKAEMECLNREFDFNKLFNDDKS